MTRPAWAWVPANRRRYSPVRKAVDGTLIIPPITNAIEAELDRQQLAGWLGREWVPPGFGF